MALDKIRDMETTTATACVAVGTESLLVTPGAGEGSGGRGDTVIGTKPGMVYLDPARPAGPGVLAKKGKRNHRHARACRLQSQDDARSATAFHHRESRHHR